MANLQAFRLAPYSPPFYYSACGYFGPYSDVKEGPNKTAKHYSVVFTSLNTRAVHVEMAVDCFTMKFLQVLRRFFAIRGRLAVMKSDNGSQFVGAEGELGETVRGLSPEEIQDFAQRKACTGNSQLLLPHIKMAAQSRSSRRARTP